MVLSHFQVHVAGLQKHIDAFLRKYGLNAQKLVALAVCALMVVMVCLKFYMFSSSRTMYQASTVQEESTIATPRTGWSANEEQFNRWFAYHDKLVAEAANYKPSTTGQTKLVFYGDSITESWRGLKMGESAERAKGVPEVFEESLAVRWPDPLLLAIAGDQTQHMLWRLAHGDLSPAMAADPNLMFVLLIGTNNLGKGQIDRHSPNQTYAGIMAVARSLLQNTKGKLLLNTILPRGDGVGDLRSFCPGPHCELKPPVHTFLPAISYVNNRLAESVKSLDHEFSNRVELVDCGAPFFTNSKDPLQEEVKLDLMPDRLHPNAAGHLLFARCLRSALEHLEGKIVTEDQGR